ncbi:MAG: VanZ family protein [Oscillospiraceae bacterium]|nr:VanZ family protein [Oscillospiraceae bacterium]
MIRTKTRLRLCVTLIVCNLIFIWGNSLLPGEVSGAFSDWVKDLLAPLFGWTDEGGSGGGLLRKVAHFTEFTTLGVCLRWLLGMMDTKRWKKLLIPLAVAFVTACIDETIQIFVPLRGPGVKDVAIDTAGAVLGIVILSLLQHFKAKFLEDAKT